MATERKVLLYSSGLDSSALFYVLGCPPALYVGGAKGPARASSVGETLAIHRQRSISPEFDRMFHSVDVNCAPFMRAGKWGFPREIVLALAAYGHNYDHACYGYVKEDGMTAAHVKRETKRISHSVNMDGFVVSFPVWNKTKTMLVKAALKAGAPVEFLKASYSCVLDPIEPCGQCAGCLGRDVAFKTVGI